MEHHPLYTLDVPLRMKIDRVATEIYGADGVDSMDPCGLRRNRLRYRSGRNGLDGGAQRRLSFERDVVSLCRLLGFVSKVQSGFVPILGDHFFEFTALAKEHGDGWGLAWHDELGALRWSKAAERADRSEAFSQAAQTVRTDAAILHLRKSTGGHRVSTGNTHPFLREGVAFIHNGSIDGAERLATGVAPDLLSQREGTTDSELFFLRLLTAMRALPTAEQAITLVFQDIGRVCEHTSLNSLLLTSTSLYAACAFDPNAPFRRTYTPYYDLHYRSTPGHVVVASSQWSEAESWPRLGNGKLLRVDRGSLAVSVSDLG